MNNTKQSLSMIVVSRLAKLV